MMALFTGSNQSTEDCVQKGILQIKKTSSGSIYKFIFRIYFAAKSIVQNTSGLFEFFLMVL